MGGAHRRIAEDDIVDPDGKFDVLELLVPDILEREIEPVADIVAYRLRYCHAAGLGDAFQPRSDVDPVAEDIVVIDDDVAQIDPDPEFDPPFFGDVGIAAPHSALNLGRAFDRVHDAWKLDQHSVTGQLDDPTLMFRYGWIDQLGPVRLEAGERADLIGTHQPAVTDHVGGQDC